MALRVSPFKRPTPHHAPRHTLRHQTSQLTAIALIFVLFVVNVLNSLSDFPPHPDVGPRSSPAHGATGPPAPPPPPSLPVSTVLDALLPTRASPYSDRPSGDTSNGAVATPGKGGEPRHPFGRNIHDLQIGARTAGRKLRDAQVCNVYRRLVREYLLPFQARGIARDSYYDILLRHSQSAAVSPVGSRTGVQSVMIQVVNNRVYLSDPFKVTRNASKPFYRTRVNEVSWLLSSLVNASAGGLPDTEFVLSVHDCVQTVSSRHRYHGPEYVESAPVFTVVGCNFSDNIPFPVWEGRRVNRDGGFANWDAAMTTLLTDPTTRGSWHRKRAQAVFRGNFRSSLFFSNQSLVHENCERIGRLHLFHLAQEHDDEGALNVSVGGTCNGVKTKLSPLSQGDQFRLFKYIIYTEGICMWSDRIRHQLFGPALIVKQETPCGQFFEPLLSPFVHYLPTNFFFTDIFSRVRWARDHDPDVKRIVRNANTFARNFLSLRSIQAYARILIEEYSKLLHVKQIEVEEGAVDVTDRQV